MMQKDIYQRTIGKLELLSVVYSNLTTKGPISPIGHKLAVQLEAEMERLFTYLQTEAKGQC